MTTTPDFAPLQPHGALEEVFDDIYRLQGSAVMGPGVRIPRNMVVLRHEGELTVVDAVRLDEAGHAALDALGAVKHVVKIGSHGMDDAWYLDRYDAQAWAPPGVEREGIEDRPLPLDGPLPVPWLRLFLFEHTRAPEACLIVERAGGVLLTCDSVQHWPDLDGCSLLAKGVTKAFGFLKRPAVIGPPWLKMNTPEGGSLRPDFERLLAEEWDHLIGGHGKPLVGGAKAALEATVQAVFD